MKLLISLLVSLFSVLSIQLFSEDEPVLFEVTTESYELLQNPASLNNGEIWDDNTSYEIELGFNIEINGMVFDEVIVNAGIGLTFPGYSSPQLWIWGSEWGGGPQLEDRGVSQSLSPIDYEFVGNPGEQILKIQWQNAGILDHNEGADPDDFVEFQIWVCEGTNRVEVHYGPSQTSDQSWGYNDGPGCRFLDLDDEWGYCIYGFENYPTADWIEMSGPVGGCLLNGVPLEGKIYAFYPGTTGPPPEGYPVIFEISTLAYDLIENPVSLNNGEIWDEDSDYMLELGFEVEINGMLFDKVIVTPGIGLTFPGYSSPQLWIWGSEWGGSPQLEDRGVDQSLSPVDYETVGDPGERILKIQWQNAGILDHNEGADPDDYVNFQMWICEGTNRVEVHYGPSQTSDQSWGYNDGPGCRFLDLEDEWGYCIYGFENYPTADWIEMSGPVGGCLLNDVPGDGKVFNFYPNPTVTLSENMVGNADGFSVNQKLGTGTLEIVIDSPNPNYPSSLSIYDMMGRRIASHWLIDKKTQITVQSEKAGIYLFIIEINKKAFSQKIMLQ